MAEFWNEQPEQNGFFDKNNSKEIAYRRKMAERLLKQGEQDGTTQIVSGYAVKKSPLEGFAKALASGVGGYQERKADEMQNELDKKRSELMAKYVSAYGQDPVGASQILMQDPELSGDAMKMAVSSIDKQKELALKESDWQREAALKRELLGIRGQSGGGNGGATGYLINQYMESTGADFPTALYAVQTGLRQGTNYNNGVITPINGVIESKGRMKQGEAIGTEIGKRVGEAAGTLQFLEANMPKLEQVTAELSKLGQTATYTKAGQLSNATQKELGMDTPQGAVDRTAYIAKVDNEILPLLRDTFGAAFTVKEGETLRSTLGNPNYSPAEKDAVLKAFIDQKKQQVTAIKRQIGSNPYGNPNAGQGNPAINQDYSQIQPVLESDMNATVPQGNVMPPAPMQGGMGETPSKIDAIKNHLMSKGMTEQQAIGFIQQNGLQ
jgi:dephospho-CoA kinase